MAHQFGSTPVGLAIPDCNDVAHSTLDERCAPLNATKDKGHQIYSKAMDIGRKTCWKNEKDGVKHGARRRSIWIDKPVQANKADNDKTQGCLWLWSNGKCNSKDPPAKMPFTQSRELNSLLLSPSPPIECTLMDPRRQCSMLHI